MRTQIGAIVGATNLVIMTLCIYHPSDDTVVLDLKRKVNLPTPYTGAHHAEGALLACTRQAWHRLVCLLSANSQGRRVCTSRHLQPLKSEEGVTSTTERARRTA
jgi:hypothetical protein